MSALVVWSTVSVSPHASVTDAELARQIMGAGPEKATEAEAQLCIRFGRRVMAYARRHLADEAAARDLTQRVLLLTLEKLRAAEVREPERISSFVLGVARTLSREMQRMRARDERMLAPEAPLDLPAQLPELEPLGSVHLQRCLGELAERERTIVVLSYFGERSAMEIGETLALSSGNVRVIRHRAIERLRSCMGMESVTA